MLVLIVRFEHYIDLLYIQTYVVQQNATQYNGKPHKRRNEYTREGGERQRRGLCARWTSYCLPSRTQMHICCPHWHCGGIVRGSEAKPPKKTPPAGPPLQAGGLAARLRLGCNNSTLRESSILAAGF